MESQRKLDGDRRSQRLCEVLAVQHEQRKSFSGSQRGCERYKVKETRGRGRERERKREGEEERGRGEGRGEGRGGGRGGGRGEGRGGGRGEGRGEEEGEGEEEGREEGEEDSSYPIYSYLNVHIIFYMLSVANFAPKYNICLHVFLLFIFHINNV
jgi:hypothetical protein